MTNSRSEARAERARETAIEAMLQARCMVPGIRWDDGMTDGVARIERMLMERALDAATPFLAFTEPAAAMPSAVLDREAIARAAYEAWYRTSKWEEERTQRDLWYRVADAVVALLLDKAPSAVGGVDRMREAAQFLSDRLDDLEWHDGALEDTLRDYMGHVDPAHARLKAALAGGETSPERGEG